MGASANSELKDKAEACLSRRSVRNLRQTASGKSKVCDSILLLKGDTRYFCMKLKIYHNPRCSKSRQTLALLENNGHQPEIIEYLNTPPSHQQLDDILHGLGMEPLDLMRRGEAEFKELSLADSDLNRDELIDIMIKHPKLIERPIVVSDHNVIIGRPPENVMAILP
jgi:arsenate reductase